MISYIKKIISFSYLFRGRVKSGKMTQGAYPIQKPFKITTVSIFSGYVVNANTITTPSPAPAPTLALPPHPPPPPLPSTEARRSRHASTAGQRLEATGICF